MKAFLLAPLRCLVLTGLTAIGVVAAEVGVVLIALIVTYPWVVGTNRFLAGLGRRFSAKWGGIAIESPDRPLPTEPVRRADGWYVHANQLYRRPGVPRFMLGVEAMGKDPSVMRDLLWLALTPAVGGLAVALPVALLVGAGVAAVRWSGPVGYGVAAGLVAVAFACAPSMLRLYGHWSRVLLQPPASSWWRRSGFGACVNRNWRAIWNGAGLAGLSLAALGFGVLTLVIGIASWGGLLPWAVNLSRPFLGFYRRKVGEWTGQPIASPYRPAPPPPQPDEHGSYRIGRVLYKDERAAARAAQFWAQLKDPASWRDLLWTLTAPFFAPVGLGLAVVVAVAFFGVVLQPLWWAPWAVPIGLIQGIWVTPWYMWYGVTMVEPGLAVIPTWASVLAGLVATGAGILLAEPYLKLRLRWDRWLLAPTPAALLAQRVHRLTETRADAVDAQAAEVRRIERDLHDGAQARLVAVGMNLATVEHLLEQDPAAARRLLIQAREASATALAELRDLVRGIHPPVLSERGLVDAVRAVSLDAPLPVDVIGDLAGRLPAPVESAAYFAICEALANATRHSGATRIGIAIRHDGERLRATVTDDGHGGADPSRGTGLSGMTRRLGTFDGVLTVHSPRGGPTVVTMEVPCALSSPRTSTS
jgi:signal transduction histidine kinase